MVFTSESTSPLVVVVGSTGTQGSSVVDHLELSQRSYRVRGLTRRPDGDAAKKLKARGVEIHQVDLNQGNLEGAKKAFEGAHTVFAVTNFLEHFSRQREVAEGKMMVDAASAADVSLFIWSGLPATEKVSKGELTKVDHFDSKAEVTAHGRSISKSKPSFKFVDAQAGIFYNNYDTHGAPRRSQTDPDTFVISLPVSGSVVGPQINTQRDYGAFVVAVMELPDEERKSVQEVRTYSEEKSYADVAASIAKASGKKVVYQQVSEADFIQGIISGGGTEHFAHEFTEMFLFIERYGYYGGKKVSSDLKLDRPLQKYDEYAKTIDWGKVLA